MGENCNGLKFDKKQTINRLKKVEMANLECFAFCGNVSLKRNVFINDSCFVAAVVASEVAAVTTVVASVALAVDEKFQRLSVSLTT